MRHQFRLAGLVRVNGDAGEERRLAQPDGVGFGATGWNLQPVVHATYDLKHADRIDVEYRLRTAGLAEDGVVSGERQHVVETEAAEGPQPALDAVPVVVLAREVDDDFLPAGEELVSHHLRPDVRIAARVVCDADQVHRV